MLEFCLGVSLFVFFFFGIEFCLGDFPFFAFHVLKNVLRCFLGLGGGLAPAFGL